MFALPRPPRDAVYWFDRRVAALPPLRGSVTVDTVVVGMGMMGLMCAAALLARGQRVCLLDAVTAGGGASGRSSGFITPDSELEFQDLVEQFGAEQGIALWKFAWSGVNAIRETVRSNGIDCDLQRHDALFVAATRDAARTIVREHEVRRQHGFDGQLHSRETLGGILGAEAYFGGIRFGETFGIDGYRYCVALRDRLIERGAQAFENSPVTGIRADGVDTAAGAVRAAHVVVCTDRCLPDLRLARREIYHAQTFLAVSEPLNPADVRRIFPAEPMMVWDTNLTYKYFRLTGDQRLLIGGGTVLRTYALREQHRPRQVARMLHRYLARQFPSLDVRFAACWPGLIGVSKDFGPVVGRHPEWPNVRFAGGAAGLPLSAALGGYLAEAVVTGRNELDEVLSVDRHFPVGRRLQTVLRAPISFALSHGIQKFG